MLTVPLTALLERSSAESGDKHLAGNIRDPDQLLSAQSMAALAEWHRGVFAFLAYHPYGDRALRDYIQEGTLADDSGPNILCIFMQTLSRHDTSVPEGVGSLIDVNASRSSASLALEELFSPRSSPAMPGIAFFASFEEDTPVYVPLDECENVAEVRRKLRELFSVIGQEIDPKDREHFSVNLVVALQKKRIEYESPGVRSIRRFLIRAYQAAWDHREDLMTAAGLVLP